MLNGLLTRIIECSRKETTKMGRTFFFFLTQAYNWIHWNPKLLDNGLIGTGAVSREACSSCAFVGSSWTFIKSQSRVLGDGHVCWLSMPRLVFTLSYWTVFLKDCLSLGIRHKRQHWGRPWHRRPDSSVLQNDAALTTRDSQKDTSWTPPPHCSVHVAASAGRLSAVYWRPRPVCSHTLLDWITAGHGMVSEGSRR